MNPKHLALLQKSIDEFNQWRSQNWEVKVDLSGSDLRGANLFKANLTEANLKEANLRGAVLINTEAVDADFEKADLSEIQAQGANFSKSNMTGASFLQANLMGASFQETCLIEADFTGSNCTAVRFNNANISRAIFYNAQVDGANFESTNLNEAHLYADQFDNANIPLEQSGIIESKKRKDINIYVTFISFAIVFIIGFFTYKWIFSANTPGALNTRIRSTIHYQVGNFASYTGMHQNSVENLEVVLALEPDNAEAHYLIAGSYRELGDFRNAVKHYRIFVDLVGSESSRARPAKVFLDNYSRYEREFHE